MRSKLPIGRPHALEQLFRRGQIFDLGGPDCNQWLYYEAPFRKADESSLFRSGSRRKRRLIRAGLFALVRSRATTRHSGSDGAGPIRTQTRAKTATNSVGAETHSRSFAEEIGDQLGIKVGAVKTRIGRGKQYLRDRMKPHLGTRGAATLTR